MKKTIGNAKDRLLSVFVWKSQTEPRETGFLSTATDGQGQCRVEASHPLGGGQEDHMIDIYDLEKRLANGEWYTLP